MVKHDFSRDLEKFGPPLEVDPGVALLQEVHRTAGHVAWLERHVRELEESELVWSTVMEATETGSVPGANGGGWIDVTRRENRQEINKWWQLYMAERKHLAQVSAAAVKVGIEERRVRLAERGVDILEAALSDALRDLGLDPSSERVRAVLGQHLSNAVDADIFGTRGFVEGEIVPPMAARLEQAGAPSRASASRAASASGGPAIVPDPVEF